jgi:hypothetical protein
VERPAVVAVDSEVAAVVAVVAVVSAVAVHSKPTSNIVLENPEDPFRVFHFSLLQFNFRR